MKSLAILFVSFCLVAGGCGGPEPSTSAEKELRKDTPPEVAQKTDDTTYFDGEIKAKRYDSAFLDALGRITKLKKEGADKETIDKWVNRAVEASRKTDKPATEEEIRGMSNL